MSSGGTRSVVHFDADHNLHCMVAGRKDFIMIEKKYYTDLYFIEQVNSFTWYTCSTYFQQILQEEKHSIWISVQFNNPVNVAFFFKRHHKQITQTHSM